MSKWNGLLAHNVYQLVISVLIEETLPFTGPGRLVQIFLRQNEPRNVLTTRQKDIRVSLPMIFLPITRI